ncbi:MAG: hypothetical protein BroJett012_09610 [Betaproteobacteria bacterium]|nr:MAG: hypothetical protein BroJett012_09610 [Betaproteobacteria bacterium]
MAIQIGKHNFDGPHGNTGAIHAKSGVYVILGKSGGTQWSVVDVGESASVRERLDNHDRQPCWQRRGHRELAAAVLYVPEQQRMLIERELRASFNPPCGDR